MDLPNIDWLISFNDYQQLWKNQPVLLLNQCLFVLGGLCTLKHAISNGGRWPLLWLTIILNGILIELISLSVPDIKQFWHSQGPVMLFGKSLPLGILFFYPSLYYTSILSSTMLQLPRLYESLATGIVALFMNLPCDYIGLKYIQWTFHDTDPNIQERNYSVPWNSYNFHFLFPIIQYILFNVDGYVQKSGDMNSYKRKQLQGLSNWKLFALNVTLPIPMLFVSFAIFYHALHDFLAVHSQIIFLLMFSLSVVLVWSACSARNEKYFKRGVIIGKMSQKYIVFYLVLHYLFYSSVPFLFAPEKEISTGTHQPIGPCDVAEPVHTLLGKVLERKKYLCWKNHSQHYFDFHCVPQFAPSTNEVISQYTICGTAFENKSEFISIMLGTSIIAYGIFRTIFYAIPACGMSNDKERKRA